MYVVEKFSWSSLTESEEKRAEADEMMAESDKATRERLAAMAKPGDDDQLPLDEAASACPTDANSLYAFTENYVEVRAAFQEDKRGLITFGFLSLALVLNAYFGFVFVYSPFNFLIFGTPYVEPWELGMFFFGVFTSTIWFLINYFFWKYCWAWIRTELFTHRHLVARFNRKTRQVHINRPAYAGGVVTLPWDAVFAGVKPEDEEYTGIGGVLILGFMSEQTGAGYDEMMMLGRPMSGNAELVGFWEYIRRYMEEGPDSVPRPKRLLKLHPFTLEPLRAALRFMSFTWRDGSKIGTLVAGTLLSPLIGLLALCHWISLLLCYQPRWPKIIEEAGQPGKPIPKLTVAEDFGPEIAERLRANCAKDRADRPLPPFERRSFKVSPKTKYPI